MNQDNGIYTLKELAEISVKAQQLARLADQMSIMTIFGDVATREAHTQRMQDEMQAVFSDLQGDMLGLIEDNEESAPASDLNGLSESQ